MKSFVRIAAAAVLIASALSSCASPSPASTGGTLPPSPPVVRPSSTVTRTVPPTTPVGTSTPTKEYGDIDVREVLPTPGGFSIYGDLVYNGYQAGYSMEARAKQVGKEVLFKPIYIINRINQVTELGILTTDPGETSAQIPLRRILHDRDVYSIQVRCYAVAPDPTTGFPKITDTLTSEQPMATSYDGKSITLSGLLPETTRGLSITYAPDSEYLLKCISLPIAEEGYAVAPASIVSWVTFDRKSYIIPPDSYCPAYVYLNVPAGTALPEQWEFWVELSINSGKSAVSGLVTEASIQWPIKVVTVY